MANKKQVWHSGPPPSIGWWPASAWRDKNHIRWWDGCRWSYAAMKRSSADEVEAAAGQPSPYYLEEIEWTDRPKSWPARSRT